MEETVIVVDRALQSWSWYWSLTFAEQEFVMCRMGWKTTNPTQKQIDEAFEIRGQIRAERGYPKHALKG